MRWPDMEARAGGPEAAWVLIPGHIVGRDMDASAHSPNPEAREDLAMDLVKLFNGCEMVAADDVLIRVSRR